MFTGIIEELGTITNLKKSADSMVLVINAKDVLKDVRLGDSIAVNGVCLTVTSFNQNEFSVDVMPETFKATSLSLLQVGSKVNLERSLAVGSRMGGHFVTGHVDGVATIKKITAQSNAIYYILALSKNLISQCIDRGSIAVDGTSLTIFGIDSEIITLSLIPHTVKNSVLGQKKVGDIVNIECDMIGKYVANFVLQQKNDKVDTNFLTKHGYI